MQTLSKRFTNLNEMIQASVMERGLADFIVNLIDLDTGEPLQKVKSFDSRYSAVRYAQHISGVIASDSPITLVPTTFKK